MERLLQEVGGEREEDGEQDAGDGEDAAVGKVRKEVDDRPSHRADQQESEDQRRNQPISGGANDRADDEDDKGDESDAAEDDDVAPVEALAGEQFGERRGDRIVGVPDEQIEQEAPDHHDADGGGE